MNRKLAFGAVLLTAVTGVTALAGTASATPGKGPGETKSSSSATATVEPKSEGETPGWTSGDERPTGWLNQVAQDSLGNQNPDRGDLTTIGGGSVGDAFVEAAVLRAEHDFVRSATDTLRNIGTRGFSADAERWAQP